MLTTEEPLYLKIRRILEHEVRNHLQAGQKMDSESRLAERFNVNRHTLRRAVDSLVQEGLIERRRGVGLFVLDPPFDYPLEADTRLTANLAHMRTRGQRELLRKFSAPAGSPVSEILQVSPETQTFCLEYLIRTEKKTLSLASHYFVYKPFEKIFHEFDKSGSLHAFIKKHYGLQLKRVSSVISAGAPNPDDATFLRIPKTLPVLTVRSVNIDKATGKPVEYVRSRFRSDRIELSVKF